MKRDMFFLWNRYIRRCIFKLNINIRKYYFINKVYRFIGLLKLIVLICLVILYIFIFISFVFLGFDRVLFNI